MDIGMESCCIFRTRAAWRLPLPTWQVDTNAFWRANTSDPNVTDAAHGPRLAQMLANWAGALCADSVSRPGRNGQHLSTRHKVSRCLRR